MSRLGKPCPHCKSPARGNPCWWYLDNPEYAAGGGDPPCECDAYAEEAHARERRFGRNVLLVIAGLAIAFAVLWLWRGYGAPVTF